jgi:hypothetical protein
MINLEVETWYQVALTWDEGTYVVYLNGEELAKGSYTDLESLNSIADIGNNGRPDSRDQSFNGLIDDVRIFNYALSPHEIETIYRVKAVKPSPVDRAVVGPAVKVELSWRPGIEAASHKVFFGSEADKLVLLAEVTSPAYAELPALQKDAQYYWRVDEVKANGTIVSGDIWSFTTSGRMLGWWKFDENSGRTASDSSGNGNVGTLQGDPVWQPLGGVLNGALEFDDGDYVSISNESNFDITREITIAEWVNIASVPTQWTAIVTKGDSTWRMSTEHDERRFHFAVGRGGIAGETRVNANQWHHVAGVCDGSQMRIYVDGELDASSSWDNGIKSNDYPVYIGENAEWTGRFWHGLIDDVRIYDYALSENEIRTLSNKGKQK